MQNVTCIKCGWVSMAVSRAYAEAEVRGFLEYYDSRPKKGREEFWGERGTLEQRLENGYKCLCCNGSKFRLSTEDELAKIVGRTINPVVWEENE